MSLTNLKIFSPLKSLIPRLFSTEKPNILKVLNILQYGIEHFYVPPGGNKI